MAFLFRSKTERGEHRVQVVPAEIRGLLTGQDSQSQQPFLIWDVSENGLGIWMSEGMKEGDKLVVTIGHPYLLVVNCKVVWCEKQGENQGYRAGIKSIVKDKPFERLLAAFLNNPIA